MSKQTINKILIVGLIVIWGFVGYRFIYNYISKNELQLANNFNTIPENQKTTNRNPFLLSTISRDPFLGTYSIPKKESVSRKYQKNSGALSKTIVWPKIEYFGFVKNENNKNPLALLKINNELKRIRKGENYNGLVIKTVFSDSIIILNGVDKRVFVKE